MSERLLVDWGVAERAADLVGGLGGPFDDPEGNGAEAFAAAELESACSEALRSVSEYTGLAPAGPTPAPELVDRREWARNGLDALALAARPLEERLAEELSLPGPFGAAARGIVGAGTGAEAGVAVGYAARRVLGQYDAAVLGPERPARLLFVGQNLAVARRQLDADGALFLRWIALHETTHVAQFEGVDWLLGHVRALVSRVIAGAAEGIDARGLASRVSGMLRSRPGELGRALLRGELLHVLSDPTQRALLDRLQATMAAIEGHAEHVMDACGTALDPRLGELRRRLDARRARRSGLGEVLARLLGLDLKLRQYERGKAFCDAVTRAGGEAALARLWRSPENLPEPAELDRPREWLDRVSAAG